MRGWGGGGQPGRAGHTPDVWTPALEGTLGGTGWEPQEFESLIRDGSWWSASADHLQARWADTGILS